MFSFRGLEDVAEASVVAEARLDSTRFTCHQRARQVCRGPFPCLDRPCGSKSA